MSPISFAASGPMAIPAVGGGPATAFDPTKAGANLVFSNSNQTIGTSVAGPGWQSSLSTNPKSAGKLYLEYHVDNDGSNPSGIILGFALTTINLNSWLFNTGDCGAVQGDGTGGKQHGVVTFNGNTVLPSSGTFTLSTGSLVQFALDFNGGFGYFGFNNTWGTQVPGSGTNPAWTWTPGVAWYGGASIDLASVGGTGCFITIYPTSGTQIYSPPSSFTAWG